MTIITAGTVTVQNGNTALVGTGTSFLFSDVAGGLISINGLVGNIESVVDDENATLAMAWTGGDLIDASYFIQRENTAAASTIEATSLLASMADKLSVISSYMSTLLRSASADAFLSALGLGSTLGDVATLRSDLTTTQNDLSTLQADKFDIADGGDLSGFRNKIINGDGVINQRSASTISDDEYGHDRHYALTQNADIDVSTVTTPADGIARMIRLTQSNAVAQRMGYAQIFEAVETYGFRGQIITLGGKLQCSGAQTIRFAVLEWTGTADSVTSDVVNDWSSPDYSASNFFNGTNLTVTATGTIDLTADTVTDWSLVTAIGSSANNIIVFFWTDAAVAQNTTLDQRWYFVKGDATDEDDPFSPRHVGQELALCQRYYFASGNMSYRATPHTNSFTMRLTISYPQAMPMPPTITQTLSQIAGTDVTSNVISTGTSSVIFEATASTSAMWLNPAYNVKFTADAEL